MASLNLFSYTCTRALHAFRSFAHCRAASTVIPLLPNVNRVVNRVGNKLIPVFGELNERIILIGEVREAVNEMKSGKAQVWTDFPWSV